MALPAGATIGIIGGGQLGRMLAMAAARLGYRTVILEPHADSPASQVANRQIVAAYDDAEGLRELAVDCDVVTYEFENVPVLSAQLLEVEKPVFPPPLALQVAQDRVTEKRFLNDAGIATAPWRIIDGAADLNAALDAFGGKGILKTRRLGYDGKGQVRFGGTNSPSVSEALAAIGQAPAILEGFIAFVSEISVIAARDQAGNVRIYDIAENVHADGILSTSTVPASVSAEVVSSAQDAATRLMNALGYVGVLGLEFFLLDDGTLLANEFAPRVHNSGHWTEAACAVSQFEQHIRAVAGVALGDPVRHSDCVMENLIGDDVLNVPSILAESNAVLHLYGKTEARPGRKMGHVTRLTPKR